MMVMQLQNEFWYALKSQLDECAMIDCIVDLDMISINANGNEQYILLSTLVPPKHTL